MNKKRKYNFYASFCLPVTLLVKYMKEGNGRMLAMKKQGRKEGRKEERTFQD
jgi:hypothetical protein